VRCEPKVFLAKQGSMCAKKSFGLAQVGSFLFLFGQAKRKKEINYLE
jgi:hypothetical protein